MTAHGAGQRTRRGLATAAAQLGVASAGITTSSGTHSCPGTAAATASASPATSVQVTFPAACAGRPVFRTFQFQIVSGPAGDLVCP